LISLALQLEVEPEDGGDRAEAGAGGIIEKLGAFGFGR